MECKEVWSEQGCFPHKSAQCILPFIPINLDIFQKLLATKIPWVLSYRVYMVVFMDKHLFSYRALRWRVQKFKIGSAISEANIDMYEIQ